MRRYLRYLARRWWRKMHRHLHDIDIAQRLGSYHAGGVVETPEQFMEESLIYGDYPPLTETGGN